MADTAIPGYAPVNFIIATPGPRGERGGSTAPVLMMQRPPDSPGPSLSQTADRRGTYAMSRRETRDLAAARLTSMPRIEREGSAVAAAEISEKRAVTFPLSRKKIEPIFLDSSIR